MSGDSHVVEPPEAYSRYIDPKYRDVAPKIIKNPNPEIKNELYWAEGITPFAFHTSSAAGLKPHEIDMEHGGFASMHNAGWDSKYRIEAQDRDGMLAEVIYPTIGMLLCSIPDGAYRQACFRAFNQWMRDYCSENPVRLAGIGQSAAWTPEETIADLHQIKELGLKGAMLPGSADGGLDYDSPEYDKVWDCAVELGLPICFHILTGRGPLSLTTAPPRGGKLAAFTSIVRELQDIAGLFVFGRVFERHPDLRVVLVESDAGWAPHFCTRMDHAYKRHRFWMKTGEMARMPSEYFLENIYMTFQDDWVALKNTDILNPRRLLWANDYPHSDSTWPWSHELLAHHTQGLTDQEIDWILRENAKELFKLEVDTSVAKAVPA
ncbi:MAG: amidohydrolase [Rhizobiaceae bacterium]|nr:MAG: amidohydrolase [Rhizobiaceae bacterium]